MGHTAQNIYSDYFEHDGGRLHWCTKRYMTKIFKYIKFRNRHGDKEFMKQVRPNDRIR